jgi:serine/threonine protein kinase
MQSLIGQTIGGYQIVEQIGHGGMATVFKAAQPRLNRFVALKMIHNVYASDSQFLMRFEREAQVAAALEHPNIVPVYDYSEYQGQPYLIMKLIDGPTLKDWIAVNPATPQNLRRVLRPLARALDYAHSRGVLHRDIKPSNIMLDTSGTPYITDFGLARLSEAPDSTMSRNMMIGTPAYMSPEQAQGEIALDRRSDLYAFAVMVYEMVTGDVPFNSPTPHAVVHDHIYKPMPLPSSRNPALPLAIDAVFLQALAKDPTDRFESAVRFVMALEEALGSGDAPAPASPPVAVKASSEPSAANTRNLSPTRELPASEHQKSHAFERLLIGMLLAFILILIFVPLILSTRSTPAPTAAAPLPTVQASPSLALAVNATNTTDPRPTLPDPFTPTPQTAPETIVQTEEARPPTRQGPPPPPDRPGSAGVPRGMEFLLDVPDLNVSAAREQLAASPSDPTAHLALARALFRDQNRAAALAAVSAGDTVTVDAQQRAAYWATAAHLAFELGEPTESYRLYSYALSLTDGLPQQVAMSIRSGAGLDLYFAATEPNAFPDLVAPTLANAARADTPPVMRAILARSYVADGQFVRAEIELTAARREVPGLAEAGLAEAELNIARGRIEQARELLNGVLAQTDSPMWARDYALRLLESLLT